MPRKLSVIGGTFFGPDSHQWRMFAAVSSRAEFCRLIRVSYAQAKDYMCETGNQLECATALSKPHVLFGNHPEGTFYTKILQPIEIKWGVPQKEAK